MHIKRIRGESRLGDHGIISSWDNGKGTIRVSRNSIYKKLRNLGYVWDKKSEQWIRGESNDYSSI